MAVNRAFEEFLCRGDGAGVSWKVVEGMGGFACSIAVHKLKVRKLGIPCVNLNRCCSPPPQPAAWAQLSGICACNAPRKHQTTGLPEGKIPAF